MIISFPPVFCIQLSLYGLLLQPLSSSTTFISPLLFYSIYFLKTRHLYCLLHCSWLRRINSDVENQAIVKNVTTHYKPIVILNELSILPQLLESLVTTLSYILQHCSQMFLCTSRVNSPSLTCFLCWNLGPLLLREVEITRCEYPVSILLHQTDEHGLISSCSFLSFKFDGEIGHFSWLEIFLLSLPF